MPDTPHDDAPQLGDTLGPSRAGRVDREIGETLGGSPSHERPSFSDPITEPRSDLGAAADRVPGAASTTPEFEEGREGDMPTDQGGFGAHSTGHMRNDVESPMRGAGTPVRRQPVDGLAGSSRENPERDMHPSPSLTDQKSQYSRGDTMDNDDRNRLDAAAARDASGKGPKTNDIIHHDNHPDVGDHIGEAAGGISGVLTGAAIGSAGGPIGTIIGGIAGAIGGWWSGRAISEAATKFTNSDDDFYRNHYESSPNRLADRKYEDVRPAYQLGHIAGHNPDYAEREWNDVEGDLQHGWSGDLRSKHGDWSAVSPYARDAYTRGRSGLAAGGIGATAAGAGHGLADKIDDLKDRVDGNPASRPGPDSTDSARRAGGMSGGLGGAASPATTTGYGSTSDVGSSRDRSLGEKIADKVDDLKDRVDGNPASRPGPDSTDDPSRRF